MNVRVDPTNAAQFDGWDGADGNFWVERADRFNEGMANYQAHLLDAAGITEDSTILDIGCGSGQTTRDAARRAPSGSALGVDLSSRSLDLARKLSADQGIPNTTFEQADAQIHPFPDEHFDVAISRHGAMFFGEPVAAFRNIARALRPGAPLVLLTWQAMEFNEWNHTFRTILAAGREVPTRPGKPGQLKNAEQANEVLIPAGFTDIRTTELNEPMYFGKDVDDAYDFVTGQLGWMLNDVDEPARAKALADLRTNLTDHQTGHGVIYNSAGLLIEARRP